ncbi:hypothetical protein POTOM_017858 [Populus tomentosa]|uniref:Uncharacterized protein n=1 Tax=Populus tomentosa TaxID=118781 RepID=A0A8X8D4I6_POPTO|nr:hypothetical protein POTOM_017858 [Populus tomentosa]
MDTRGYFQRNVRICMSTNPFFDIGTSNLKARGICKKQDYWKLKMEQCLRVSEGKASPKRDFRALLRGRNNRSLKSNLTESIGQVNGGCVVSHTNENGFVRMKLVVRKQDLKQMLEVMGGGKSNANQASYSPVSSLSLEQRLNLLRRKHLSRSNSAKGSCRRSWTPALQSIPE